MKVSISTTIEITAGMNGPHILSLAIEGRTIGYLYSIKDINGDKMGYEFYNTLGEKTGHIFKDLEEFHTWLIRFVSVRIETPLFRHVPTQILVTD